jgi:hypothetical protein
VHPDKSVYESIKKSGLKKIRSFDASRLPRGMVTGLGNDLMAVGYSWVPELDGMKFNKTSDKDAARFILGGLIFGGYAQASRTDHMLQTKRARMFVALSASESKVMTRGIKRERQLFAGLNRLTNQDQHFKVEQEEAPPTVLHHLLAQGIDNTQQLLQEALRLRDSPAGQSYRRWHRELRKAWGLGRNNIKAQAELDAVTEELKRRLSGKPLVLTRLTVSGKANAKLSVNAGIASADAQLSVRAKPVHIPVGVPSRIRNWFVDHLVLSRHQKLLLEMSLDRRSFDHLAHGMQTAWDRTR